MTDAAAKTIGFIGTGIMGKPMVRNLVKAGYEVVIHNRSQRSVDELTAESDKLTAAGSPADVARAADTVILMLPDSPDVRDVVFGENGVLNEVRSGFLLIDMSTIAPSTAIEVSNAVASAGGSVLDAPVSGGDKGAIAGTLSIMVGGTEADLKRAMPLFEVMGKTIVHIGGPGAGQIAKACNQVMVAVNYAAASEALVLAERSGVDPGKVAQVLGGGLANSRVLEMRGETMIKGEFQPGFRVDLHRKDLAIALATGRERQSALPVTALVSQLYDALSATGGGQLDHSALISVIERMSGE
ncbi:MAG TPA: 2-hydroxy-3-oxopropionate reductase [Thermomicrobiales bacterium]|nr:2-hydroxy-3-oxopropionate reductase [Thermomicrobiales bacterium]